MDKTTLRYVILIMFSITLIIYFSPQLTHAKYYLNYVIASLSSLPLVQSIALMSLLTIGATVTLNTLTPFNLLSGSFFSFFH